MKPNSILGIISVAFVFAYAPASAASASESVALPTVSTACTGAWIDTFSVATNYAFSTGKPLVMLWSNDVCDKCNAFKTSLNKSAFKKWQALQPYVFCAVEAVSGSDTPKNRGAKAFAASAGGYGKKNTGGYPMVSLLWLKGGVARSVATFTGRSGKMGVSTQSEMYMEFIEAIETTFANYTESDLGAFTVADAECDRFEAEPSTGAVRIPVDRTASGDVATNVLEVYNGGTKVYSTNVVWGEDDTREIVEIPLGDIPGLSYDGSSVLGMKLSSPADGTSTNGAIHLVASQANGPTNPYWIGEKDELEAGEWSMDIDAVTNAVAAGRADYAIVFFTANLWCPHCQGLEEFVFDTDAFRSWAKSRKVVFALLDNPRRSPDVEPTIPNGAPPTLLRYEAGVNNYAGTRPSGAAYLTRKGIEVDDAEAVLRRNHTLGYPGGFYATPEASRTGYPTLMILGNDFAPAGRFVRMEESNGASKYYHDPDEHMQRLEDLLLLRDSEGEGRSYVSLSTLSHTVGSESSMTLQINDRLRVYTLAGMESAGTLTLQATNAVGRAMSIEYLVDGTAASSSSNGSLSVKVKKADLAKSLAVRIDGYPDTAARIGGTSVYDAGLVSSFEPSPVVDSASLPTTFAAYVVLEELDVADGQTVAVKKSSGTLPSGLRLKYDKSTRSVVLYGTPSKAVVDATFAYTVTVKEGRTKTVQEPVEVTVSTYDPSESNPYLSAARSATVPLVTADGTLAGTLTFSMTAKNKVTAKYAGTGSKSLSFSSAWMELSDDGTASLSKEARGVALDLQMDADGVVSATLDGLSAIYSDFATGGAISLSGSAKLAADFTPYAGYYTVVLPSEIEDVTGTGYIMLKFTSSSSVSKGKVGFSGLLPNGQSISGTSYLSLDPDEAGYALLPVFRRTSKCLFSALLRIQANGASLYADDETVRVVLADEDVAPYFRCTQNGVGFEGTLGAYGGWYPMKTTVSEWLEIFEEQTHPFVLAFVVPAAGVKSELHGTLVEVPTAMVAADARKNLVIAKKEGYATISFNKTSGLFSGKAKMVFEDGKTVSGTYKGLLTPGWLDCGCGDDRAVLPFGSGTLYYSDKVDGVTVKKSIAVELQ